MLTGCASAAWVSDVDNLMRQGRCDEALSVTDNADTDTIRKMVAKGEIYKNCTHDIDKASAYFTLAARYGTQYAMDQLIQMGKPVPAADLQPVVVQINQNVQNTQPQPQQQQRLYQAPQRDTQTRCGWQGSQWVCDTQPTGIDTSIYNIGR